MKMKKDSLLVFDLDDTIFETKSIDKKHVAPILDKFEDSIKPLFKADEVSSIISDLWKYPFDHVSEKYGLGYLVKRQFSDSINSLNYELEINPFDDFELIQNIEISKVLVTTGFKKLQLAKIDALNLEESFEEIYIDEIDASQRIYKRGIFQNLIDSREIERSKIIVIGDNPNSEIKAGHELGLKTVQVAKFGQPKSSYADHYIQNYQDLIPILEQAD